MSRHFFDTGKVRVRLGYDRPLDEFFMRVERLETDPDCESLCLYASLDDPGDRRNLEYYRQKLQELDLTVPNSLFEAVREDAVNRVGNRYVQHFADGRMVENVPN